MHQLSFQLAPLIPAGTGPSDVVLADLNGDNKLDLAATTSAASISVSFGDGTGGFGPKVEYAVGAAPSAVVAADFDGDGKLDLATANYGADSISILKNNGAGGFTLRSTLQLPVDSKPIDIVVGNFNADANRDIAVVNSIGATVSVVLGAGDGTFNLSTTIQTLANPVSLAVGRFNADNIDDLVIANFLTPAGQPSQITVALGAANGGWTIAPVVNLAGDVKPNSVAIGDFNNDGKADFVTANEANNTLAVALGDGGGGFTVAAPIIVGDKPGAVQVADFNDDGQLDIATANFTGNNLSIALGNGLGRFTHHTTLAINGPRGLATGDLNGDGKLDFVTANQTGNTVSALISTAERSEIHWRSTQNGVAVVWNQANGTQLVDGRLLTYGKGIDASRVVGSAVRYDPAIWRLVGLRDLNGDSVQDIVYTRDATDTANGAIRVLTIGQFNGQAATVEADQELVWAAPRFPSLNGQLAQHLPTWSLVGVEDMTGDGQGDFVFYSRGLDRTVIWTTNQAGQIVDGGYVEHLNPQIRGGQETGAPNDWSVQALGDFTGDGKTDILWRNTLGTVVLWELDRKQLLTTKSGVLTGPGSPLGNVFDRRFRVKGVGDFNNDGVDDVIWRDQAGNESRIWTFGTNGKPTSVTLQAATTQWEIGGVADMNRDGADDIIWRNNQNNTVVIWNIQNAAFSLPGSGAVLNYLPGGNQLPISPGVEFQIDAVTGLAPLVAV
jgi:FG-GAP-like repeat/FG-GAP repeat